MFKRADETEITLKVFTVLPDGDTRVANQAQKWGATIVNPPGAEHYVVMGATPEEAGGQAVKAAMAMQNNRRACGLS